MVFRQYRFEQTVGPVVRRTVLGFPDVRVEVLVDDVSDVLWELVVAAESEFAVGREHFVYRDVCLPSLYRVFSTSLLFCQVEYVQYVLYFFKTNNGMQKNQDRGCHCEGDHEQPVFRSCPILDFAGSLWFSRGRPGAHGDFAVSELVASVHNWSADSSVLLTSNQ